MKQNNQNVWNTSTQLEIAQPTQTIDQFINEQQQQQQEKIRVDSESQNNDNINNWKWSSKES